MYGHPDLQPSMRTLSMRLFFLLMESQTISVFTPTKLVANNFVASVPGLLLNLFVLNCP